MLGFNHVLAGSIIAVITPAPLVPLVAFVSHFLLDLTPHFGQSDTVKPYTKQFKLWLCIDAMLCFAALGFACLLFPDKWFIIAVGAFFGALPDFFVAATLPDFEDPRQISLLGRVDSMGRAPLWLDIRRFLRHHDEPDTLFARALR